MGRKIKDYSLPPRLKCSVPQSPLFDLPDRVVCSGPRVLLFPSYLVSGTAPGTICPDDHGPRTTTGPEAPVLPGPGHHTYWVTHPVSTHTPTWSNLSWSPRSTGYPPCWTGGSPCPRPAATRPTDRIVRGPGSPVVRRWVRTSDLCSVPVHRPVPD